MDPNYEPPKIVFEDEQYQQSRSFQKPTPKMVELVIIYSGGAIKDEKQANYVLVGSVVVAITVSLFLIFDGNSKVASPPPTPFEQHNL